MHKLHSSGVRRIAHFVRVESRRALWSQVDFSIKELQIAHFLEKTMNNIISKKVKEINQSVLNFFFSNFLCCSVKLLLWPDF